MATPNRLETNSRGGIFVCIWRPLLRVWRLVCCCCGPDEPELSVEETSPSYGQSSVRPW